MSYDVFLIEISLLDCAEPLVIRESMDYIVVLEGLLQNHCVLLINDGIKLMCVLKLLLGLIIDPGRL